MTANTPIHNILVHIDGSEESVTAGQYAICLAKTLAAELTAIYVVNTRALRDLVKTKIFLQSEEMEYEEDLNADADRYLNHIQGMAREKGVPINQLKATGSINQEIKKAVETGGFDLLVIGELSNIRSRKDEFYNEAERAMRSVRCPVLIVKDEETVWDMFDALT